RAGHTGTLDPFASGVLPVCVGKATRLARFLAEGDKVYEATIRLGFATTTDDLRGEPLGPARPVSLDRESVEQACRRLTGPLRQVPPSYSARRVGGRRLYELARQGIDVEREAAGVTVHAFDVRGFEDDRVEVAVTCSPGTYVRALARDLGDALGVGGHLVALRRTRSADFTLDDAVDGSEPSPAWREKLRPLDQLLPALPAVVVGSDGAAALRHGRDVTRRHLSSAFPAEARERFRVLDEAGRLLALAVPRGFAPPAPGLAVEPVLHPDLVLAE
ncbi:MAG: tRNA pseudouridine(55) synthase TruB, partial [Acidobacteria bacterium]